MSSRRRAGGFASHLMPALALILAGTIAGLLVILAPDLQWFLPDAIRRRRVGMGLVALAAIYALAREFSCRRPHGPSRHPAHQAVDGADRMADVALSGGLTVIVATTCLAFLATWLPHYLLWPWSRDADTFATLAQSWDAGIRPYRDIRGYNFPGAIYLSWMLGKLFGWGSTWALYAFDGTALIALGALLAAWSRRCLGRMFAGLAGYLVFLTFYLSRDFETVAQRDWHASLCIVLGLMLLQGWPGRASRIISALLCAAALATRPHAVLFLPALASAVVEGGRSVQAEAERPGPPGSTGPLLEWSLALAVFIAMACAPLLIAGIAGDLIRGLKVAAFGGPYNRASPATAALVLAEQLGRPAISVVLGLYVVTVVGGRGASRHRAVTWLMALSAALAYRLFHPVQHAYLAHPLALVGAVALALPIAWIIDQVAVPSPLRAIAVLAIIVEMSSGVPRFCDPAASVEAIRSLARGETLPLHAPPGSGGWFDPEKARWYAWGEYRDALVYLRRNTRPGTTVANVLEQPPYPAINGPAGRLSPFRAESGICWMLLVDIDLEPEFAAALEQAPDCVVVWSPGEHEHVSRLRLERLAAVIRERYRPEARFGHIEVWRRSSTGGHPSPVGH